MSISYLSMPPDNQWPEYVCMENNRNAPDAAGFQTARAQSNRLPQ
ncbi:MAG: hypothetical protein QM718_08035 [Steroidobacteraceae bacterium]